MVYPVVVAKHAAAGGHLAAAAAPAAGMLHAEGGGGASEDLVVWVGDVHNNGDVVSSWNIGLHYGEYANFERVDTGTRVDSRHWDPRKTDVEFEGRTVRLLRRKFNAKADWCSFAAEQCNG